MLKKMQGNHLFYQSPTLEIFHIDSIYKGFQNDVNVIGPASEPDPGSR